MIGIIIVNYNDWENLRSCISSIDLKISHKIYVVDNASAYNSIINEIKDLDNVHVIESTINGGYSFGNNLGIKKAMEDGCDYFIVSNTDILFHSNSIDKLLEPLQNNFCDIVGPRILLANGKNQEEILGVRVTPLSKIKLIVNSASNGLFFKRYRLLFNNLNQYEGSNYFVYGVSGCCFSFNLIVAKNIFPLDEKIFLYNEEWMLAEKAFQKKFKTIINKYSVVTHFHGATTKNIKLLSYYFFVKSEFYVLNSLFPLSLPLNLIILFLRMPKFFIIIYRALYNRFAIKDVF